MRCCICGSDCKGYTTNLRKREEAKHEQEKMVLPGAAGDSSDGVIYCCGRRSGDETVELAAARALWLAPDHLLARAWDSGTVPDLVRRFWRARGAPLENSRSNSGALGTHDA